MDVDSALLRTLCVLAEDPHAGRAAARLGITQQAVSKRVARLESLLAIGLLDRTDRRRPRLTPAARELVPWARAVVDQVDRFAAHAGAAEPGDAAAPLRVDVMESFLAPAAWVRRGSAAAGLRIETLRRPPDETAEHLLLSGRAQVAFGRAASVERPWPEGILSRPVHLEPLALLLPAAHPWAAREEVRLGELAGSGVWFPMLMAPVEWRTYVADLDAAFGLGIGTGGSSFSFETWARGIHDGDLPPSLVGEAMSLPDESLRTVPIIDPTPVFAWSVLWRADVPQADVDALLAASGLPRSAPVPDPGTWLPSGEAASLRTGGSGPS